MANILYLVHRIPFPPNKGDKVRSYHLLAHLVARHRIFLATFVDDLQDERHIQYVKDVCTESMFVRLNPRTSKLKSIKSFYSKKPMSLHFYHDDNLQHWIDGLIRKQKIDSVLVFSSPMAQYMMSCSQSFIMDFVDVDSAKWLEYALDRKWPLSWIYRREGTLLASYEKYVASKAQHSFFVTPKETNFFLENDIDIDFKVSTLSNGVDFAHFRSSASCPSPFDKPESKVIVFSGAMDYWPNIDAVIWFAHEVFPLLKKEIPSLSFYIVGRNPADSVLELGSEVGVFVTGTVADVRPFLQHASVVVAPLRVARGIQNKVLEAMSMEQAVVASSVCVEALGSPAEEILFSALDVDDYLRQLMLLLRNTDLCISRGKMGRQFVIDHFDWEKNISAIDPFIDESLEKNLYGYSL